MRHSWHAVTLVSLAAGGALAENKSVHVTLTGDVAATDNVFATTADQNEGDLLFTIRPGILLGYDAPRMTHDVSAEGEVINYALHSDAPSVAVRGGLRSAWVTSRHTNLITQLNASNGVLTALSSRLGANETGGAILRPIGHVDTVQGDASESLSWSSGRDFTLGQTLFARASRVDDNADDISEVSRSTIITSMEAGGSINVNKNFRKGDSLSLEAGASILRLERDAPPDAMLGPRLDRQINPRGRVSWRHDFNRVWSGSVDGGLVYVYPYAADPNDPSRQLQDGFFPIVGASAAYTEVWGRAQASVRRDVTPNLLVAQNTVNDSAVVQLAMPLPWLDESRMRRPKVIALGSFGLSRTRLLNADTSDDLALPESSFTAARLDVGLGYSPRPGFTYGIRYEFIYQTGTQQAEMVIPGFFRNTLSFTFAIRYPDRVAGAEVPKRRGEAVRADGKDLVPIGVDPFSTEDFEQDGGEGGEE